MDLIFPSGFRITLPEEANEECELIKTVLELEEVSEISISLPQLILKKDTYLNKYELSYDELGELTEEELSKWLQLKAFLGYYESSEKYDNEMKKLRKVINKYKERGVWSKINIENVCLLAAKNGNFKVLKSIQFFHCKPSFSDIINQIKPNIIEHGLKTALFTGTWGNSRTTPCSRILSEDEVSETDEMFQLD